MASQYNVMQSPFCSNQQMFQPRYSGHHDWGMHGYSTFPPPFYQHLPHAPPAPPLPPPTPLPQCQPSSPFVLCFISGNISSCFGCKAKYTKSLPPPSDLCIRHQDWREFSLQTQAPCRLSLVMFTTTVSPSVYGYAASAVFRPF